MPRLLHAFALLLGTSCLWGTLASTAEGQSSTPARQQPHLPGAVVDPPTWIAAAPFDLGKFFALPPADENAAPLYLDALFEFSDEVASCFPLDQRGRARIIKERASRLRSTFEAWLKDPASIDAIALDALLEEYRDGIRKLDEAQRRPRCTFAIGITPDALLPHASAAREVGRLLVLKAHRDLERGDIDGAIANAGRLLRLSRDLRPRGPNICQIASISLDGMCSIKMVPMFLAETGLNVEHCDRLLVLCHSLIFG